MNNITDLKSASRNLDWSLDEFIKMFYEESSGDKSIISKDNELGKRLNDLGYKNEILENELKLFFCAQFLIWVSLLRDEGIENSDVFIDRFFDKLEISIGPEKFPEFEIKLRDRYNRYKDLLKFFGIERITHKEILSLFLEFINFEQNYKLKFPDMTTCLGLGQYLGMSFFQSQKTTRIVLETIKEFIIVENVPPESVFASSKLERIFNGKILKSEARILNGKVHGLLKIYNLNGLLETELVAKNGEPCGTGKNYYYYEDGTLKLFFKFINKMKNGLCKLYYPSGVLNYIVEYRDDKLEGIAKFFHENGTISQEGRYFEGIRIGGWLFFDVNGNLSNTGIYEDGKFKPMGAWDIFKGLGKSLFKKN